LLGNVFKVLNLNFVNIRKGTSLGEEFLVADVGLVDVHVSPGKVTVGPGDGVNVLKLLLTLRTDETPLVADQVTLVVFLTRAVDTVIPVILQILNFILTDFIH